MRAIAVLLCLMAAMLLCRADESASQGEYSVELAAEMPGLTTASDCETISSCEIAACDYGYGFEILDEMNGDVLLTHLRCGPHDAEAESRHAALKLLNTTIYGHEIRAGRCQGVGV